MSEAGKVGKRGTVVIPAAMRRRFGLDDGSIIIAEEREDGILIRPATVLPLETYSRERKAEFLLTNAVDSEDYRAAVETVKAMGLDPARILHKKPAGKKQPSR